MKRSRGFTLIEISIVMVIVGLLVGGILVGRELIAAAQMRGVLKVVEQSNTAVNTSRATCVPPHILANEVSSMQDNRKGCSLYIGAPF